jgi:hypothetical protein
MILVLLALKSMIGLNDFLHNLCISGSLVRYLMLSIQPFFLKGFGALKGVGIVPRMNPE